MINNNKTSLLIPSQLPEYIRDNPDYENFVSFLQSYYEWMEQDDHLSTRSKNILNYQDVDQTTNEFIDYFTNVFVPNFPKDILIDKAKTIKYAGELYRAKGTPDSFKFLFRVLFNSNLDFYFTKDSVFKASGGNWYIPKSVKLKSLNPALLKIKNYKLFGETSKTIAIIEISVVAGNKTEIFISNIERLFQTGEFVQVLDNNNQIIYSLDGDIVSANTVGSTPLRGKIAGQISKLTIDPNNRGLYYKVGDPVILYNGLIDSNGIGAIAEVGSVTSGSIQDIKLVTGGFGYTEFPNTIISISGSDVSKANAIVSSLDPAYMATVTLFPIDTLNSSLSSGLGLLHNVTLNSASYFFPSNPTANINTTLANTFTFKTFSTYPISSTLLINGGGGINELPTIEAIARVPDSSQDTANSFAYIKNLGMLAPIQIKSGGKGYRANDIIVFSDATGYGAYANVINVSSNGAITSISYIIGPDLYPLGGMGYRSTSLPSLSIISSNVAASNAEIYVPGILGDGATFEVITDRIGSITNINVLETGEDYTSNPSVSLTIQDILVSNVSISYLPEKGDFIYQGTDIFSSTYFATVNSISILSASKNAFDSIYKLRVFNYGSINKPHKPINDDGVLHIDGKNINMMMANTAYDDTYDITGVRTYGNAKAKANSSFLNGLNISEGLYLNEQGHPSAFDVLQSKNNNNFTYQITVEKEIAKYRDILMNLLHPSGMKMIGRYVLKSDPKDFTVHITTKTVAGKPLNYYTDDASSSASMYGNYINASNNIIQFNNLNSINIATFISNTNIIEINSNNMINVKSEVISVDFTSNTITIKDNVWLSFANVATVTGSNGSSIINITSISNLYENEMLYAGDQIKIANNTDKIISTVDYENGLIYLTSNLTNNVDSYMSVNKSFTTNDVKIWNTLN